MPRPTLVKADAPPMSAPLKRIAPGFVGMRPATVFRNVDLPAPFAPMMATVSPGSTVRLMPKSAWKSP